MAVGHTSTMQGPLQEELLCSTVPLTASKDFLKWSWLGEPGEETPGWNWIAAESRIPKILDGAQDGCTSPDTPGQMAPFLVESPLPDHCVREEGSCVLLDAWKWNKAAFDALVPLLSGLGMNYEEWQKDGM